MVCPFDLNDDGADLLLLKKADVAHLLFSLLKLWDY
jgi:hypothetical protein